MNEYLFDVTLLSAIRVRADSAEQAAAMLKEALDCADTNFGAWPNGDPILSEVSMTGEPDLAETGCRDCGREYDEGGDGYNGRCPDCADIAESEGRADD